MDEESFTGDWPCLKPTEDEGSGIVGGHYMVEPDAVIMDRVALSVFDPTTLVVVTPVAVPLTGRGVTRLVIPHKPLQ